MNQSSSDYAVGLPGRYALSLFEIAQEEKNTNFIKEIDNQLLAIAKIIDTNNDFNLIIKSPIFAAEEQLSIICLLYTSPSPRDLSTSRMPSSA